SLMAPEVVIRPILFRFDSVNHSAPSGPVAIPVGRLPAVGVGYSKTFAEAVAGNNSAASTPSSTAVSERVYAVICDPSLRGSPIPPSGAHPPRMSEPSLRARLDPHN